MCLQNDVVKIQSEQPAVHPHAETMQTSRSFEVRRTTEQDTYGKRYGSVSMCSRNDVVEIQSWQLGGLSVWAATPS